jgi:hypothetical protein
MARSPLRAQRHATRPWPPAGAAAPRKPPSPPTGAPSCKPQAVVPGARVEHSASIPCSGTPFPAHVPAALALVCARPHCLETASVASRSALVTARSRSGP